MQLETVTEYFDLVYDLNFCSKREVFFPCVSQPLLMTFFTKFKSVSLIFGFENLNGPMGDTCHHNCDVHMTKKLQ